METLNELEAELTEIFSGFYERALTKLPKEHERKEFRPIIEERTMESTRKVAPENIQVAKYDDSGHGFPPAPTITSITPPSGGVDGNTAVTVTGTHFLNQTGLKTKLYFGGVLATSIVIVSSTQLTARTPAHAAGKVNVKVENLPGQKAELVLGYEYLPNPTLGSVNPNNGPVTGGTTVEINGSNFVNGATVSFGGVAGTSVSFVTANKLMCITPAHASGAVNVVVVNPSGQTVTLTNGFTYHTPTLTAVAPPYGDIAGGKTVTITGTNFESITALTFGGTSIGFTVVNSTTITCTTPAHADGLVAVSITNSFGLVVTKNNAFRYLHSPNLDCEVHTLSNGPEGDLGWNNGQTKTVQYKPYDFNGVITGPYPEFQGWCTVSTGFTEPGVSVVIPNPRFFITNGIGTVSVQAFNGNPPAAISFFNLKFVYDDYPTLSPPPHSSNCAVHT